MVAFSDDGHVPTTLGVAVKLAVCLPEIYGEARHEVVLKRVRSLVNTQIWYQRTSGLMVGVKQLREQLW